MMILEGAPFLDIYEVILTLTYDIEQNFLGVDCWHREK